MQRLPNHQAINHFRILLRTRQPRLYIAPHQRSRLLSTAKSRPCSLIQATRCSYKSWRPSSVASLSTALSGSREGRLARIRETYATIADGLLGELRKEYLPQDVITWYKHNLDYNVFKGQLNRVTTVVEAVELMKRRPLSDDEYLKAAALGWATDLVIQYMIVTDDIMDKSLTRRGEPCWYRRPDVGMFAVNDGCMLLSAAFRLLKLHFKNEPSYLNLVEVFLDASYRLEVGQLIDQTAASQNVDLDKFSHDMYGLITTWKTGHPAYHFIASAMYMCGIPDTPSIPSPDGLAPPKSPYELTRSILLLFSQYGQTQNDYLDFLASGDENDTVKIGTDIINNKCTWLINTALEHATPEQRKILDEHYGKGPSGGSSELKVKAVFEEIGIHEKYNEYEKKILVSIRAEIARIPELELENTLRREVFENFLVKLHRAT